MGQYIKGDIMASRISIHPDKYSDKINLVWSSPIRQDMVE